MLFNRVSLFIRIQINRNIHYLFVQSHNHEHELTYHCFFVCFFVHSSDRCLFCSQSIAFLFDVFAVTDDELRRLFRRFKRLDTDKSGALSITEFLAIPELEHNPLVQRVVATFDSDKSGEVSFAEFISALSVFTTTDGGSISQSISQSSNQQAMIEGDDASDSAAKINRFHFTFKLYDVDNDGFISNADLFHVLKTMVGNNLNDVQLQQLVDRTILQGDLDKDGKLSYAEFKNMVKETDIDNKLKIEIGV